MDLIGRREVARILGLSPTRVTQLARENPTFPAPAERPERGPGWHRAEIEAWKAARPPGNPGNTRYAHILTAEFLRERYTRDGLTMAAIAREIGCSPKAVAQSLDRFGIPRHKPVTGLEKLSHVPAAELISAPVRVVATTHHVHDDAVREARRRRGLHVTPGGWRITVTDPETLAELTAEIEKREEWKERVVLQPGLGAVPAVLTIPLSVRRQRDE